MVGVWEPFRKPLERFMGLHREFRSVPGGLRGSQGPQDHFRGSQGRSRGFHGVSWVFQVVSRVLYCIEYGGFFV